MLLLKSNYMIKNKILKNNISSTCLKFICLSLLINFFITSLGFVYAEAATSPECMRLAANERAKWRMKAQQMQGGGGQTLAMAENQAVAEIIQDCESQQSHKRAVEAEIIREKQIRQNLQHSEREAATSMQQANENSQQKLKKLRKEFCLENTKPIECNEKVPAFTCFEYDKNQLAVFKDSSGACFVTTCECFNFYRGN